MKHSEKELGVYFHWPFCLSKCHYCNFNSYVKTEIDYATWFKAFVNELKYFHSLTNNHTIKSIFFGGGSPSLLSGKIIESLINEIHKLWKTSNKIEISLEVNPNIQETKKLIEFKISGINRISLGVQSINDNNLNFLGRTHTRKETIKILQYINQNFNNYSFDLIYGIPNQNLFNWELELKEALTFAKNHVSIYQLSIEKNTNLFTKYQKKQFKKPSNYQSYLLYEKTKDILKEKGFSHYEISNYCKINNECKHNLLYWNYKNYLGIGPGAHSRLDIGNDKWAISYITDPKMWLSSVLENNKQTIFYERTKLTKKERLSELLIMGLRLKKGITQKRFKEEIKETMIDVLNKLNISFLIKEKLITFDENRLALTEKGLVKLNLIIKELIA